MHEITKPDYLNGRYVLRVRQPKGHTEYRILHDKDGKYRISRWHSRDEQPEILADGLSGDEAWNFLKLIGE